jgi:DNA-binding transcriptional LysR family regulator
LFDRSKRAIQLTAAGKYFYRDTTEIFKALERAKRNVASSSTGQSGALKVGFMMSSAYNILPAVTRHYSAAYPEVDMRLSEYVPNLLATDIEDEKIDVGIMYRPEIAAGSTATPSMPNLLAVLPRGHRLARQARDLGRRAGRGCLHQHPAPDCAGGV